MTAKLFVRGMKEPVELTDEEGNAAQALLSDSSKGRDTAFVIEGVWAGNKGDMKFVVFGKKEIEKKTIEAMPDSEAKLFEKELESFRNKAVELGLQEYNYDVVWQQEKGAIRLEIQDGMYTVYVRDVVLFAELERKISSYKLTKQKWDFAKRKQDDHLERIAQEDVERLVAEKSINHVDSEAF